MRKRLSEKYEKIWNSVVLGPPVKYFADRSREVFLLWTICVISIIFLLCFRARLFIDALWSPAGKGLTSWLSFVSLITKLSLFHWYLGIGFGA